MYISQTVWIDFETAAYDYREYERSLTKKWFHKIRIIFSRTPKSAIFGVLSALVKDSRQFKQREKRLLNVVTVNLRL